MAAAAPALLVAACSREEAPATEDASAEVTATPGAERGTGATADRVTTEPPGEWRLVSSGEGDGLFFAVAGEPAAVHLFCPRDGGLLVNVGRFTPVGSEERMSLGSGGTVVALVADPAGDPLRGGVSGEGPVPAELRAILTGADGVGVNYGAQDLGPMPQIPDAVAGAFLSACGD